MNADIMQAIRTRLNEDPAFAADMRNVRSLDDLVRLAGRAGIVIPPDSSALPDDLLDSLAGGRVSFP